MKTLREYLDQYRTEHSKLGTRVTHFVGIPMIVASLPTAFVNPLAGAGLFAGGWALQFVGHYVFEKQPPSFFSDPLYLLVGPLWVLMELLEMIGIAIPGLEVNPVENAGANGAANGTSRSQAGA
jgi:uncharacterized membrane protein YGL010W